MMVMMLNLLWTELLHFGIELLLEKTKRLCAVKVTYFKHVYLMFELGICCCWFVDLFYISLTNKNAHYNKTFSLHSGKTVQW